MTQDNRVSVDERLPEDGQECDVWPIGEEAPARAMYCDGYYWFEANWLPMYVDITYWQPLPDPPKDK